MGLDIRIPLGSMFTLLGLILAAFGLGTGGSEIYQKSLGININLIWGAVMLVFGLIMLALAWSARGKALPTPDETAGEEPREPRSH